MAELVTDTHEDGLIMAKSMPIGLAELEEAKSPGLLVDDTAGGRCDMSLI
jgi:hypothetical protein